MSDQMSPCLTVYTMSRGHPFVVERVYGDVRKATQIAKRAYKKTRRPMWVEDDDGKRVCAFGRSK